MKTKAFQSIPGVGVKIAQLFIELGFTKVADLKNRNPERIYEKLCAMRGQHIDRCVLYVFRSAVYFASHKKHNPALLSWWNWKDTKRKKKVFRRKGSCGSVVPYGKFRRK